MFRKLILSAVLATGTITGLTLTPTAADAQPVDCRHDRDDHPEWHRRYEVLYRECDRWVIAGFFEDRCNADRAADNLRHRGLQVEVRPV
jgi:hypothetical protein